MKPGFALNLSHDGIGLLHRTARGWVRVGEVSLDDPALGETLGFLRKTALGLEPQGLTTKLIIPNSQILYTEVAAPGPDAASRRRQIRAALDGRTPYTVDELVFDWTPLDGDRVRVAVVARETLQEAEEFAADHRMAPVSFVAMPDEEGDFAGEPFFGATRLSNSLLPPGERVERDADPVRVIGGAAPKVAAKAVAGPEPESAAEVAAPPETSVEPEVVAEDALDDETEALRPGAAAAGPDVAGTLKADAPEVVPADEPEADEVDETDAGQPVAETKANETSRAAPAEAGAGEPDEAEATEVAEPEKIEPDVAPAVVSPGAATGPAATAAEAVPPEDGDLAAKRAEEPAEEAAPEEAVDTREATASPAAAEAKAEGPAADAIGEEDAERETDKKAAELEPAGAAAPAFASRRAGTEGAVPPMSTAGPRLAAVPSRISLPGAPARGGDVPSLRAEAKPGKELAVPLRGKGGRKAATRPAPPPLRARVEITPQTPAEPLKPGLGLGAEALAPAVEARRAEARAPKAEPAEPTPAAARPAATDAPAATTGSGVFGARSAAPVRGKPRHLGLILTLVLLLLLGLVAVWSSLFLGTPERAEVAPGAEVAPPAPVQLGQAVEQDAAPPMPGPEELLLAEDSPFVTEPGEEIPADVALPAEDLPPPGVADLLPDAVAAATPGSNGDPAPLQRPDQTAASADPEVLRARPILPALNAFEADAPPAAPVDPAPAEALLAAIAAAEAALEESASGPVAGAPAALPGTEQEELFDIEVVEGAPATVPPPNPFREAETPAVMPELDVTDAVLEALAEELPSEGSVRLLEDPSLAGVRPRARPTPPEATATDPAAPQAEEQGAAETAIDEAEASATALAGVLRPRVRPASLAVAAAMAPEPEPEPEADDAGSALALAASVRPVPKPSNFNAAVEQALAAALAAAPIPAPQQPARAAVPEVEEDNEPDIAAAAVPNIPTRASVAAAATVTRGINLREMNLIGVAGTANNRRALVRMSNGRVVQVRVGDRLDGGQVAAISDRQLRYVKSGRNLVLEIPQG